MASFTVRCEIIEENHTRRKNARTTQRVIGAFELECDSLEEAQETLEELSDYSESELGYDLSDQTDLTFEEA